MKAFVLSFILICVVAAEAKSPKRYTYDNSFNHVAKKGCQYALLYKTDSNKRLDFYNCKGQLVARKHYSTSFEPEKMSANGGQLNGEAVQFHANGRKANLLYYINGLETGQEQTFDTAGNLIATGSYKNGRRYSGNWLKKNPSAFQNFEHYEGGKHMKTVVLNPNGDTSSIYFYRYKDGTNRELESAHLYNKGQLEKIEPFGLNYRDTFFYSKPKDTSNLKANNKKDSGRWQSLSFKGGDQAFQHFIGENLVYPENAKTSEIKGEVLVCFIVGREDNVIDLFSYSKVDPELIAEALRIIELTDGLWIPSHYDGVPKLTYAKIPIIFELE